MRLLLFPTLLFFLHTVIAFPFPRSNSSSLEASETAALVRRGTLWTKKEPEEFAKRLVFRVRPRLFLNTEKEGYERLERLVRDLGEEGFIRAINLGRAINYEETQRPTSSHSEHGITSNNDADSQSGSPSEEQVSQDDKQKGYHVILCYNLRDPFELDWPRFIDVGLKSKCKADTREVYQVLPGVLDNEGGVTDKQHWGELLIAFHKWLKKNPKYQKKSKIWKAMKGVFSKPKGMLSKLKGVLSKPKGVLSKPKGVISEQKGVLSEPV